MFPRIATLVPLAALFAVASAAPNAVEARTGGSCNSGSVYCCNQAFSQPTAVGGILGAVLVGLGVQAGLTCDPVSVIGLGSGGQCTQQTACCENNYVNGLVNVFCSPINVNV